MPFTVAILRVSREGCCDISALAKDARELNLIFENREELLSLVQETVATDIEQHCSYKIFWSMDMSPIAGGSSTLHAGRGFCAETIGR